MLLGRPTDYHPGTPLGAIKKNGIFKVENPLGEDAGTYVVEVINTTLEDGTRHVIQKITRLDDGVSFERVHTGTATLAFTPTRLVAVPSADDDPGVVGDFAVDATGIYFCVDTDTWLYIEGAAFPGGGG